MDSGAGAAPPPGMSLPVVDLSLEPHECAPVLRQACEEFGFFYLSGHGVPEELLAATFREMESFFSLTLEQKQQVAQDKNNRGYTHMEEETLDLERQKERGDTKEGYYIGVEIPEDNPRAQLPLHGPNQWPDPDLVPTFRPTMEAYFSACNAVCMRILKVVALALCLPEDYFLEPGRFDHAVCTLRPLHYSLEMSNPEEGVFGCGAHTDYGMVTLLAMGGPGLEICTDPKQSPEKWRSVGVVEGAFVVNIGDMLERWTNGKWRSTLHRVIIPPGMDKDRYSIPFFFEPNFDCLVEALPTCTSAEDPPRWPPITAGEHLLNMYRKTHASLDTSLQAA